MLIQKKSPLSVVAAISSAVFSSFFIIQKKLSLFVRVLPNSKLLSRSYRIHPALSFYPIIIKQQGVRDLTRNISPIILDTVGTNSCVRP